MASRGLRPTVRRLVLLGAVIVAVAALWAPWKAREEPLAKLIEDLSSPQAETRREAAIRIHDLGASAVEALPVLVDHLKDDDEGVVQFSTLAILRIGRQAVPTLIRAFDDPDAALAERAAFILGRLGPVADGAVPHLQSVMKNGAPTRRILAAQALWEILGGPPDVRGVLEELLRHGDPEARKQAAETIGYLQIEALLPALIEALGDEEAPVRGSAAQAIRSLGEKGGPAVPGLIERLKDPDESVRNSAVWTLGSIGRAAAPAVPTLIEMLKDPSRRLRQGVLHTLGRVGPGASDAVPAVVDLLADPEWSEATAGTLEEIGPSAGPAIPALNEMLGANGYVGGAAQRALAKIGHTTASIDILLERAKDPDGSSRFHALDGLASLGTDDPRAIAVFRAALNDSYPLIRIAAAEWLWEATGDSTDPVRVLLEIVHSGEPQDRQFATSTLAKIEPNLAIPILVDFLKARDANLRKFGARTLGEISGLDAPAIAALRKRLKDRSAGVRVEAAFSLWKATREATECVPVLIDAVAGKESTYVRRDAMGHLAEIGPEAKAALPVLEEMARTDPLNHEVAARAVRRIHGNGGAAGPEGDASGQAVE